MSGFLLLLVKVNLAMGAAIVLVSLIRRPLRAQFGAPIAYAIWLLVPIASVASLLPPREVPAPAHVASVYAPAAPAPVTGYVPQSTFDAIEQMARHDVIMPPTPVKPLGSSYEIFDTARLIFAAWALGLLSMAGYLIRVQLRFSAAVRRGQAGPAVLGFFRPRIVTPGTFQEQFTPQEQAAILAHERVHLARQDARINALAAFLRCFCWFNPLIHLGARWLRIDQELACDASALSDGISRRDYSMALLKSQVMVGVLPFGCNWPGPQHPLVERIALLQRKPPGSARRLAGTGLVVLAATSAGLGAWAAQPPVVAKVVSAERPRMATATRAAIAPAQDQTVRNAGSGQPVAPANPTGTSNDADVSKGVSASRAGSEASVAQATAAPSSETKPIPKEVSAPEISVASNDLSPAPVLPPPNAAPLVALNDQHGGQAATRDLTAGPVQASLSAPPAAPPKLDTNQPYTMTTCGIGDNPINTRDGAFMGRVTSSTSVQVPYFSACRKTYGHYAGWAPWARQGRCENNAQMIRNSIWGPFCPVEPWFTINLLFANPADASKMPLGKVVRLKGVPFIITQNNVDYLGLKDAKVLYADPFGRSGPERSAMIETPKQLPNAAAAPGNAITPTKVVSASVTGPALNDLPATPVQPSPNASPAVALNGQPVVPIQPTTLNAPAGPVQVALSTPPATPAKTDSNDPYVKRTCSDIPNNTVTGRVTSSTTIQMPTFACANASGTNRRFYDGAGFTSGYLRPCSLIRGPLRGRYCQMTPLLTMTVQFANPADASKMPPGKLVTLSGDFFVITNNKIAYFFVQNAKFLYADPFGR